MSSDKKNHQTLILNYVKEVEQFKVREIQDLLDWSPLGVRKILSKICDDGWFEKYKKWGIVAPF